MSRIIGLAALGCIACLTCGALPNISTADEQPIDYKAALSMYLGQSGMNPAGTPAQTPPAGPTAASFTPLSTANAAGSVGPANSANAAAGYTAQSPPIASTTPASPLVHTGNSNSQPIVTAPQPGWSTAAGNPTSIRASNFVSPATPIAPATPLNLTGHAIATQLPPGINSVTPAAGVSTPSTPIVPSTSLPAFQPVKSAAPSINSVQASLPIPSATAQPASLGVAPNAAVSSIGPFGETGANETNGIVEQDGELFYLEPVYEGGPPTISGEVPGLVSCEPYVESCGACCQECCASLCGCRQSRTPFWLRGELLAWGVEGQYVPALLSRSPAGTPGNEIGVLSRPATETVFGNDRMGDDLRIGGRVRGGMWFNQCRKFGLDGDFFYLGDDDEDLRVTSDSGELFARPFINTNPAVNAEDAELLVAPRIANSEFLIDTNSTIYSVAPTFRWNAYCCEGTDCCCQTTGSRLDFLAGYRYFRFDESIKLTESFQPSGPFFAPGTTYEFYDAYETENEFHGGELGLNYMMQRCRWIFDVGSRVALGKMRSRYSIDGHSRVVVPGVVDQTVPGGFLTAGSKLGRYERDSFAIIPQAEINIGYCITPNLRIHAGYNFIYVGSVIRPGSLITRRIDSDEFLTETMPDPTDQGPNADAIEKDVWMQGVNFGFTYNF